MGLQGPRGHPGSGLLCILFPAAGWLAHHSWLLPQPAASPLTCAGFLGSYSQVQSSSLLVTPTWPLGKLGPCMFPQPCQKQQKCLWLWGSGCTVGCGRGVLREPRQEGPVLAFLQGTAGTGCRRAQGPAGLQECRATNMWEHNSSASGDTEGLPKPGTSFSLPPACSWLPTHK